MKGMVNNSIEKGLSAPNTPERSAATLQPGKVDALKTLLLEVNDIVSESNPSKPGEQWSGSGGQVATTGGTQGAQTASWRDQAIANIPSPQIMQKQLEGHIQEEIKALRTQASKITDLRKPGAAHRFNELHSKIHRLNALLAGLFEASFDVLKRIFIRVFVDKQAIL
jgi:hypothetical protein